MIKYDEFLVINEAAKVDTYQVGDYVVCDKDFRGINYVEGKLCKIEKIKGEGDDKKFTLKIQKPDEPISDHKWMVISKHAFTDSFTISRTQAKNITKLTEDEAKNYVKGSIGKLVVSNFLEDILKDINIKIKKKYIDISFVNIDENKPDVVTSVLLSKYNADFKSGRLKGSPWETPIRQSMKISKFFRKLDPDLTDQQIDLLITKFKISWERFVKDKIDEIRVVTGEDIRYWYLGKRYGKDENGYGGSLGNSCMRHNQSQRRFDIYCENPDRCAMAIILDPTGKLMSRAIIWKTDKGEVYMDRIYYVNDEYGKKMDDYRRKQKMSPFDRNKSRKVTVKRDYGKPSNNPYMDTFKYFNHETFTLLSYDALEKDLRHNNFKYSTYTDHD